MLIKLCSGNPHFLTTLCFTMNAHFPSEKKAHTDHRIVSLRLSCSRSEHLTDRCTCSRLEAIGQAASIHKKELHNNNYPQLDASCCDGQQFTLTSCSKNKKWKVPSKIKLWAGHLLKATFIDVTKADWYFKMHATSENKITAFGPHDTNCTKTHILKHAVSHWQRNFQIPRVCLKSQITVVNCFDTIMALIME